MTEPTREELQAEIERLKGQLASQQAALTRPDAATGGLRRSITAAGDIKESTLVTGDRNLLQFGSVSSLTIRSAIFRAQPEPGAVPPKELLWTYLNQVIRDTATLELSGVDRRTASDQEEARLELAAVFTELDTLRSREVRPEGRRGWIKGQKGTAPPAPEVRLEFEASERQREPVIAFVSRNPYAALLGDPGSGKTTFAKFLALALASDLLGLQAVNRKRLGDDWTARVQLPVLVVLRQFAAQLDHDSRLGAGDQLWKFLERRLGQALAAFVPLLRRQLLTKGGIVILDGLDEVPEADHTRELVKDSVLDFQRQFPKVRLLLTSRTYAYQKQGWRLPGFAEAVLAPFSAEQIERFVDRWYAHIAAVRRNLTSTEAAGRATLLKHAVNRNPCLAELAQRPLLLTLMASLHAWRGGTLPERREELYDESVELLLDVWERPKVVVDRQGKPVLQIESAAEWFRTPQARILAALEELAFDAHLAQKDLRRAADIPENKLAGMLLRAADPSIRQGQVLAYIRDRAGLLINRGERVYCFPHRTFQEYLAARHLTHTGFPGELVELARGDIERWREVVLLAGAKVARGTPFAAWSLVGKLCAGTCSAERAGAAEDREFWLALLAGQLLVETGVWTAERLDRDDREKLDRVRTWLATLIGGGRLPIADRAAAGITLGKLGDPRAGVGVTGEGLPDIVWLTVEGGRFLSGHGRRPCDLVRDRFQISKYPTTVAQYLAFVEAGGYAEQRYWTKAGWDWRTRNEVVKPDDYGAEFQTPNHPRVGVSWYEAIAFCQWFSELSKRDVTLPSEHEWERAARHTDGRVYTWGNEETECAHRCNMCETGIGNTSAVGMFPSGNAVCGASDMTGNVWEWCLAEAVRPRVEGVEGADRSVMRGGSWDFDRSGVRCAVRFGDVPHFRNSNLGFRVVVSPF